MRHVLAIFFLLTALACPAMAGDIPRQVAQVPLLPMDRDADHPDIDQVLVTHWQPFYRTDAENSFGPDQVRVGQIDLNDDGRPELLLMIDGDAWLSDMGNPLMIANWLDGKWVAVGWSWGDEDSVFVTVESKNGWRTIDTGTQILRWDGREYQRENRTDG